jgi:large subunit ribosomal protein L19
MTQKRKNTKITKTDSSAATRATGTLTKVEMLDAVESRHLRKKLPHFEVGDIVDVHCTIKEAGKQRTQIFTGTVIARKGRGINETFTVRRIVGDEGVERIFPLHCPSVTDIRPVRSGKTRRAKLYFLRERTGKAVRLAHRHSDHTVIN